MNEFIKIMTHGRRLAGETKTLSIDELERVIDSLHNIIKRRKHKTAQEMAAATERQKVINGINELMLQNKITTDDLMRPDNIASSRKGQKRPVKYEITDEDGSLHRWTGIGKMPVVFREAFEKGHSLEEFSVHKSIN